MLNGCIKLLVIIILLLFIIFCVAPFVLLYIESQM